MGDREFVLTNVLTAATTLGALAFGGCCIYASAGAGTVTILDGTATKFIFPVPSGSGFNLEFANVVTFTNLIVTTSGTPNYTIAYHSRP